MYTPQLSVFPSEYYGNLFYADYCAGVIKRIDSHSGEELGVFVSKINYPLNMLLTDNGDFYYIERNASGDGISDDNTFTSNGRLWKISYSNTSLPFISIQPEDLRLVPGDNAVFKIAATGQDLRYQWSLDGKPLIGEVSDSLLLESVQLIDNGNLFSSVVSNSLGHVVSRSVRLEVLENNRPVSTILQPQPVERYRAGDTLFFEGFALDQEDGEISPENLSWKINFHHDSHYHPFLSEITHSNKGWVIIPTVGETSANVWYRVILTSRDSKGFTNTVYQDVFPELVKINILSHFEGLRVNLDGANYTTAFEVKSVSGLFHTISAPIHQVLDKKIYFLEGWNDDDNTGTYDFYASEDPTVVEVRFASARVGTGSGLYAQYYDDPTKDFSGSVVLERIDSNISFQWLDKAPDPQVPEDQFSVIWTGFIEAPFDGEYTFYISGDDGFRLWLDYELAIDDWQPSQEREGHVTFHMESKRRYPILVEYFEAYGYASCELSWSSRFFAREVIMPSQLYPAKLSHSDVNQHLMIHPNPVKDAITIQLTGSEELQRIQIHDLSRRLIMDYDFEKLNFQPNITLDVADLATGLYIVTIKIEEMIRRQKIFIL